MPDAENITGIDEGEEVVALDEASFSRVREATLYVESITRNSGSPKSNVGYYTGKTIEVKIIADRQQGVYGPIYQGKVIYRDMKAATPTDRWKEFDDVLQLWVEEFNDLPLVVGQRYLGTIRGKFGDGSQLVVVHASAAMGKGIKVSCIVQCDPDTGDLMYKDACLIVNKATGDLVLMKADGTIVDGTCPCDPTPMYASGPYGPISGPSVPPPFYELYSSG